MGFHSPRRPAVSNHRNAASNWPSPAKPPKARARKPAVTRPMAVPSNTLGMLARAKRSLMPAKRDQRQAVTQGRGKGEHDGFERKCVPCRCSGWPHPSTAQLVVMSGKKMPSARYRAGMVFCIMISTSCTRAAMTRMKAMVCKVANLGRLQDVVLDHPGDHAGYCHDEDDGHGHAGGGVHALAETPINGQWPRNLVKQDVVDQISRLR